MYKFVLISIVMILSACATHGKKFQMSDVHSMQPGVTTKDEAIATLGKPRAISSMGDGSSLLQWMFIEASAIHSDAAHVAVLFDRDGRMVRITHEWTQ